METTQILIVDDEPDVMRIAAFDLQKLGYGVLTAVSGQEALDLLKDNKPNLVLMDIVLKGRMDGIEAARQIRSSFNIPVVYLTAHTDDKMLDRAKITGPFGYIIKPFSERDLRVAIEIALYKAKMENQLKSLAEKLERSNRELRSSKASFHNIVEKNADGTIVVDRNGIVRFVNPAAEVLFGHKADEILGESFGFPVLAGEVEAIEIDIVRSSGENGAGEMRTVKIEWESEPAYLVSIRDITKRKRAEEAYNRELKT